jgi:hypothetical protein
LIDRHGTLLWAGLEEADPAVIMEAGLIMPRPGEEAAWLEANKAVLAEAQAAA